MADIRNNAVRGLAVLGGAAMIAATGSAVSGAIADASPAHTTVRSCSAAQIAVSRGAEQGAAGTLGFPLVFTNTSKRTCTITGYPGLNAINRSGRTVARAKRNDASATPRVHTITLRPTDKASAFVTWNDMNSKGTACRTTSRVRVTVPNTYRSFRRNYSVGVCNLQVQASVAGSNGVAPAPSRYVQARRAWITSARVSAAEQNRYLDRAAFDLAHAKNDYRTQVRQLRKLAALPETNETKQQQREAHYLVRVLDKFFHTPKLYS